MNIDDIIAGAHDWARKAGFHDTRAELPEQIAIKLALVHAEVSEALEEARKPGVPYVYTGEDRGKPEGLAIELADVVIRVCDLCGMLGIDLAKAIELKMEYNKTRQFKHGKLF